MIAAIMTEPFTQQAIVYLSESVVVSPDISKAGVPTTSYYSNYENGESKGNKSVPLSLKSAAYNGLFNLNSSAIEASTPAQCTTGNCSFLLYVSLALCTTCVDVNDLILLRPVPESWVGGKLRELQPPKWLAAAWRWGLDE